MNRFGCMSLLLSGALLVACGSSSEPPPKAKSAAGEGRIETGAIRNTENLGYSGNAIGGKVDRALDANADRTEQLNTQLGEE